MVEIAADERAPENLERVEESVIDAFQQLVLPMGEIFDAKRTRVSPGLPPVSYHTTRPGMHQKAWPGVQPGVRRLLDAESFGVRLSMVIVVRRRAL